MARTNLFRRGMGLLRALNNPHDGTPFPVPVDANGYLEIKPVIRQQDFSDPTKSFKMVILKDGIDIASAEWQGWQGADINNPDHQPTMSQDLWMHAGSSLVGRIIVGSDMQLGFDIDLVTIDTQGTRV